MWAWRLPQVFKLLMPRNWKTVTILFMACTVCLLNICFWTVLRLYKAWFYLQHHFYIPFLLRLKLLNSIMFPALCHLTVLFEIFFFLSLGLCELLTQLQVLSFSCLIFGFLHPEPMDPFPYVIISIVCFLLKITKFSQIHKIS